MCSHFSQRPVQLGGFIKMVAHQVRAMISGSRNLFRSQHDSCAYDRSAFLIYHSIFRSDHPVSHLRLLSIQNTLPSAWILYGTTTIILLLTPGGKISSLCHCCTESHPTANSLSDHDELLAPTFPSSVCCTLRELAVQGKYVYM